MAPRGTSRGGGGAELPSRPPFAGRWLRSAALPPSKVPRTKSALRCAQSLHARAPPARAAAPPGLSRARGVTCPPAR